MNTKYKLKNWYLGSCNIDFRESLSNEVVSVWSVMCPVFSLLIVDFNLLFQMESRKRGSFSSLKLREPNPRVKQRGSSASNESSWQQSQQSFKICIPLICPVFLKSNAHKLSKSCIIEELPK